MVGVAGVFFDDSVPHPVSTMTEQLSFDDYQRLAGRTAVYPGRDDDEIAAYPALGLAGEAGEVCEKIKKAIRDEGGKITDKRRRQLKKELGDVLWYLAALCTELDVSLDQVARDNIDKLADRQRRDAIRGEGDDR